MTNMKDKREKQERKHPKVLVANWSTKGLNVDIGVNACSGCFSIIPQVVFGIY